jgi:hypothetical protein
MARVARLKSSQTEDHLEMTNSLPPHYLELVADAALKSYWRHQALWRFLRRCGISEAFLATWVKPESKRDFLNRLFPKLELNDAGVRLINRMADALTQQTAFPDLEGWEDSRLKKQAAKESVAALRECMEKQKNRRPRTTATAGSLETEPGNFGRKRESARQTCKNSTSA